MGILIFVSFVWAFSFGLIKNNLTNLDLNFVAAARILVSFLLFLPFIKMKKIEPGLFLRLFMIGFMQYGLMYVCYLQSFKLLLAHEVALFTILTPLYLTGMNDCFEKKFHLPFLLTALMGIVGPAIIFGIRTESHKFYWGFFLVQLSNLFFAFGQLAYKKLMASKEDLKDQDVFGILYLGGLLITAYLAKFTSGWPYISLTIAQMGTLLYLGIIASGIGFFLWNLGARKVNAGALALLNNAKLPLAVLVTFIFFGEKPNALRFIVGAFLMSAALFLNERYFKKTRSGCLD